MAEYKFTLGDTVPTASWIFPILKDKTILDDNSSKAVQGMIYKNWFIFNDHNMNTGNATMLANPNTTYFVRLTLDFTAHSLTAYIKNLADGNSNTISAIAFKSPDAKVINQAQFYIAGDGITASSVKLDYFRIYDGRAGLLPIPDMIEIGAPVFTDLQGNPISSLQNGGSVKATINITNHATDALGNRNIVVILALKDSQNKIKKIECVNDTITFGATKSISKGFELPADVTGLRCELYAWDSLTTLKPYMLKTVFPSN